jgi:peroxiredoxin
MKKLLFAVLIVAVAFGVSTKLSAVKVGDPAPAFTTVDDQGKTRSLSEFKGKYVVLEWHNNGCPYVKKHYGAGNMQKLQREWTGKGVAWLTIISSAPGTQGYVTADQSREYVKAQNAAATAVLLDPSGDVGHLYDAKTSPHMIVINPEGVVVYNGAIDDKPTADPGDIEGAKNYVSEALTAAMAGKPVATPSTQPYGCSVKYAK